MCSLIIGCSINPMNQKANIKQRGEKKENFERTPQSLSRPAIRLTFLFDGAICRFVVVEKMRRLT